MCAFKFCAPLLDHGLGCVAKLLGIYLIDLNYVFAVSLQSSCLSNMDASSSPSSSSESVPQYSVDVHHTYNGVGGARAKLDAMAVDLNSIMSPFLLEENLCFGGEFRHFDLDLSRSIGAELVDALEDVMFDDGETINDLNFDLDMEELAWINVAEGCRV